MSDRERIEALEKQVKVLTASVNESVKLITILRAEKAAIRGAFDHAIKAAMHAPGFESETRLRIIEGFRSAIDEYLEIGAFEPEWIEAIHDALTDLEQESPAGFPSRSS